MPALSLVILLLTGAARADESAHHLEHQSLCVDPGSVMLQLELPDTGRARSARAVLTKRLTKGLQRALAEAELDYVTQASCRSSEDYVALYVRVSALDEGVYKHHGPEAFGYALSLQVGDFADTAYLSEHHQLSGQRFEAFDEQVYSEAGRAAPRLERYLPERAQSLFAALAEAWAVDNP